MDRIVSAMSARLDRAQQLEGSARRMNPASGGEAFRTLVNSAASTQPAAQPGPQGVQPTDQPAVSGWAGLVTAGKTGGENQTPSVPAAEPEPAPTLESVFGSNPWEAAPAGNGPLGVYFYNPIYFATQQTAEKVAQLMGGTVVQSNQFCSAANSPFQQLQPNRMVQLPNGKLVNPGLVATFYTRGYSQSFINNLLNIEATS